MGTRKPPEPLTNDLGDDETPTAEQQAHIERNDLLRQENTQLRDTYARDVTLLCDNCKGRLQRAHDGDERARNAVYPEGTPAA